MYAYTNSVNKLYSQVMKFKLYIHSRKWFSKSMTQTKISIDKGKQCCTYKDEKETDMKVEN